MKRSEMQSAAPPCCASVAVLFVRADSGYKGMVGVDCWDADRDALTYPGGMPVVAHPPCRAWGVLAHMARPKPGERELALWAVDVVRREGGVLEHPHGSRLWREAHLPESGRLPDAWGGYTIKINQYHFGHVANKPTKLYVCGCPASCLPPIPHRGGRARKSMTGQVSGTVRCTKYEREYTPPALRAWLVEVARRTQTHNASAEARSARAGEDA